AESNKEESTKRTIAQTRESMKAMWQSVEQLKSNPHLSSLFEDSTESFVDGTVDSKYFAKRLQELQERGASQKPPHRQDASASSEAVLTLCHDGSVNGSKLHQLKELSDRLNSLEGVVGSGPGIAPETLLTTKGGIVRNIECLNQRFALLCDQSRLSALKKNADTLKEAFKDIQSSTLVNIEEQSTKSKEQKINKMFEMMERWDEASHALPAIVDRLKALKDLNQ
ncbi:hypothetical protein RFI_13264, partial [Reticulomyxa filosa]